MPNYLSFYLVASTTPADHRHLHIDGTLRRSPRVRLLDELFWYVWDQLRWVPVVRGSFDDVPFHMPVVGPAGAVKARQVVEALRDLFATGPDVLELSGDYVTS